MSFLGGNTTQLPAMDRYPIGIQVARVNTNQQARPVPIAYGNVRLGVTFISDFFDVEALPVNQNVGKNPTQVGTNYFASFAALACMGPVDVLYDVILNGQPVYASTTLLAAVSLKATGSTSDPFMVATFQTAAPHGLHTGDIVIIQGADQSVFNGEFIITVVTSTQFQYQIVPTDSPGASSNGVGSITAQIRLAPVIRSGDFADITLPNFGVMRLYWGTENQTPDSYLISKSGVQHPAYLGQCYIVFHQLFFGFNQTNAPNVELVIRRSPSPAWATNPVTIQADANPAYVLADLLQDQRAGLALPDEALDTAAIDANALTFSDENLGVSPLIDRAQDLRSILVTLSETTDSLVLLDASGLLSQMIIRPPGGTPPALADADLSDLPAVTTSDWTTAYTDVKVTYTDANFQFQDNLAEWRDTGIRNVVENPDTLQIDRKWITRDDLAQTMASVAGQAAAIPALTAQLKVRFTAALYAALAPGVVFQLNYSLRPELAPLIFRVTSRNIADPAQPEFEVQCQADRTYLYTALLDLAPVTHIIADPTAPPLDGAPPDPSRTRLVELPAGLCPGVPALAVLVARWAATQVSFQVWRDKLYAWSGAPPDSYDLIGTSTRFAWHGSLQADYGADTRYIDLERGAAVQLDGPDLALNPVTAFEALIDNTLVFINDEICSLAGWTLLGPALYNLQLVRGRFGTPIQAHSEGVDVFIVNRADLLILARPEFQPANAITLKVPVANQPVGDAASLTVNLSGIAWRVPPPAALSVNGTNLNANFSGGGTPVTITWVLPDPGGLLPRFDITSLITRLQFYIGATQIASVDVPWPSKSYSVLFRALNGGVDASFTVNALTVSNPGWEEIDSATQSTVAVLKV